MCEIDIEGVVHGEMDGVVEGGVGGRVVRSDRGWGGQSCPLD